MTFHRVLPDAERSAYPHPGLVVTPEELDQYLHYFSTHFDCGTLATQHARFLRGEKPPRPLLAVTFDDGQYDNYRYGRIVLGRHKVKASFFVPVEAVQRGELLWHDRLGFAVQALLKQGDAGKRRLFEVLRISGFARTDLSSLVDAITKSSKALAPDDRLRLVETLMQTAGQRALPAIARLMTFGELAELVEDGHEIGSHSMTHRMMPQCDEGQLHYETRESRRVLQDRLQIAVDSFCYPNGDCDSRSARAVAEAGYLRAVTTAWGSNTRRSDRFQLRRFNMNSSQACDDSGTLDPALLSFRMSGLYPRSS